MSIIHVFLAAGVDLKLFETAQKLVEGLLRINIQIIDNEVAADLIVDNNPRSTYDRLKYYFVLVESDMPNTQNVFFSSLGNYIPNLAKCIESLATVLMLDYCPLMYRNGNLAKLLVVSGFKSVLSSATEGLGCVYLTNTVMSCDSAMQFLFDESKETQTSRHKTDVVIVVSFRDHCRVFIDCLDLLDFLAESGGYKLIFVVDLEKVDKAHRVFLKSFIAKSGLQYGSAIMRVVDCPGLEENGIDWPAVLSGKD